MRLKLILFMLLSILIINNSQAQYKISIEIKDNKDTMLILGNYYLSGTFAIDTAYSKKPGKFIFQKKDKHLENGIYFFANTTGRYSEFVIDNESNFTITTNEEDWAKHIKSKGSKSNSLYFEYMNNNFVFSDKVGELNKERANMTKEAYEMAVNNLRLRSDTLKEEFLKNNPNHLLSKVLTATKDIEIPEINPIYKNDGSLDSAAMQLERYNYYVNHYFDNVDLQFDGLLRTPRAVFYDYYNKYWDEVMKFQPIDSIFKYANIVIDKSRGSKQMFKYLVHDITERYLKSHVMGHDEIYVRMIKKYYESGEANWMKPSDLDKEIERANKWEKLSRGKVVPDIQCPDTNDLVHSLYSLNSKYKILIFWAYDCGHCATEIPKLYNFYKENKDVYNVEVMAVNSGMDLKQWREFIVKKGLNWLNVNGLVANYDWHSYFDISSTPYIVILDKDNRIIAKKISAENIPNFIKYYDQGLIRL